MKLKPSILHGDSDTDRENIKKNSHISAEDLAKALGAKIIGEVDSREEGLALYYKLRHPNMTPGSLRITINGKKDNNKTE